MKAGLYDAKNESQTRELVESMKELQDLKFGLNTKRRRDARGKIIDDTEILKNSNLFKNPNKKKLQAKVNKKDSFKEEFEGLSAKQLIDKLRGNK